ncbi:hypothetical protein AVEN_243771-1 [Araneus ventricosus]|uniref:Uncharacterized protein n=1 Tax=Araneus ventricosus TaxID=182803 RepID=A0A4Y2A6A7_ARAVE|nr:hypothetical protein AVEN_243771-1 [Araneus ventricosus]
MRLLKHRNVPRELQIQFLRSTYLLSPTLRSEPLLVDAKQQGPASSLDHHTRIRLTKSLEKSAPKKTSLSVPGVRDRPGGRGGKTNGLQKRKFDQRNDTIHHRTHQTTMILPLWTAIMISTWISTMGINQTQARQLASFVMESSLKTLAGKCGLNVLCAKCGHT